jgi:tRNA (cmo5U34)-methyltransferase
MVIDGGSLPGTSSTVIDLREYEASGAWSVLRAGALSEDQVAAVLRGQFHFDPGTYLSMMLSEIPGYPALQEEVVVASGVGARRILELGTGTGETARRLLECHTEAALVGIDASEAMLDAARAVLPRARVELRVSRLEDPLPAGSFDVVASALCVHHLDGPGKASLFARVREALAPGGLFVLGDVVVPDDPVDARTPLTEGFDKPSTVGEQLSWLREAGFSETRVTWERGDLAVIVAAGA